MSSPRSPGLTSTAGGVYEWLVFTDSERREPFTGTELRRRIAHDFLALKPGDRLPTVRSLAAGYGASLGGVQDALVKLQEDGAISLDRRHRRGASLLGRSIGRLWEIAAGSPLVVSFPLPTAPRVQGLATAMKALLTANDVAAYLIFVRGARQRLDALRRRQCHLAVMSSLSAGSILGDGEEVVLELPARSYVLEHRIYFVQRPGRDLGHERALIDPDSADFEILTQNEFGGEAELISATYMQFLRLIAEDRADAAILDSEEEAVARFPPWVRSRPLSAGVRDKIGGRNTRAAFVARRGDEAVRRVLDACISADELGRIQADVVNRDRLPEY